MFQNLTFNLKFGPSLAQWLSSSTARLGAQLNNPQNRSIPLQFVLLLKPFRLRRVSESETPAAEPIPRTSHKEVAAKLANETQQTPFSGKGTELRPSFLRWRRQLARPDITTSNEALDPAYQEQSSLNLLGVADSVQGNTYNWWWVPSSWFCIAYHIWEYGWFCHSLACLTRKQVTYILYTWYTSGCKEPLIHTFFTS